VEEEIEHKGKAKLNKDHGWNWADLETVLASIVDSSDDAIIGKTLNGIIMSWNPGAERIYGYSVGEIKGKSVSILVPRDRPDEIPEILKKLKQGEKVEHYETVRMKKDGKQIHVSLTISPIRNVIGKVMGASTIARDITKRKKTDEALKSSESQLKEQKMALEEKNTAFTQVIAQIEIEKNKIKEDITTNVNKILIPVLKKIVIVQLS